MDILLKKLRMYSLDELFNRKVLALFFDWILFSEKVHESEVLTFGLLKKVLTHLYFAEIPKGRLWTT